MRLIGFGLQVVQDLRVGLDLSLPESIFQELLGLSLLLALLLDHVPQQVSVSLHQALSILEPMLQLLLPISLYSLQQGPESQLLALPEAPLTAEELVVGALGKVGGALKLFEAVCSEPEGLCLLIVFHREENPLLLPQVHKLF